jgi:uncharacterized protein YjbI with pentapeptide repeats
MKASEVLSRYAAGERDFRHANLRGQSFKGQDLSGADFSEADIRGTNFAQAQLQGANFTRAVAGVQRRWLTAQFILALLLSVLLNFTATFLNAVFTAIFFNFTTATALNVFHVVPSIAFLVFVGFVFFAIARQGFTANAISTITVAVAFTVAFAVAFAVALAFVFTDAVAFAYVGTSPLALVGTSALTYAFACTGVVAGAVAFAFAGAVIFAFAGTSAVAVAVAFAFAFAFAFADTGAFAVTLLSLGVSTGAVVVAGAIAVASLLLGLYCSRRALKGDEKFVLLRSFGIALAALSGTSFRGANLTSANFNKTILKGTNFTNAQKRETILEWVCWQDAQQLDRARVGNSMLANSAVRELLVTRDGYKKSYVDANLRTANLNGANLEQADLTLADLTCATLRYANLKGAMLAEALVLHTDFTGAYLTGACLEAWNIDSRTILEQVDCQYVYLLRPQQERRPSSGNFAPEEFTKLFQEVLSTVDLIFRNGVDWKAFVTAFQQVQVENEDTPLEIQSIENKGDGVVVVRVSVSPDANKEKIHGEFNQQYELALQALEAKYRAELQAKESEITIYREQSVNMWGVINSLANRPLSIVNENKLMSNSSDQSRNINVGRDLTLTGSTLNLGEISGTVTNTINQLPDSSEDGDRPPLKELLTQLQAAIEADADLPDPDKADLLEQVQNLAVAQQTEEPAQKEGLVRKARKMFEVTLKSLPETAKIVEACSKLLPMILRVLGVPV